MLTDLFGSLGAAVGLDQPDHDVDALRFEPVPFAEHRVRLADSRGRAKIDLEPASRLAANQVQELLGSRSLEFGLGHRFGSAPICGRINRLTPCSLSRARFSSNTLTRGEAPRIAPDRLVCPSISAWTLSFDSPRATATRGAWKSADCRLMSGSSPEPEAVTRSTGTGCSVVAPSAAVRPATRFRKSGFFVPRFEPLGRISLVVGG